jgi:ABC-type nitrate/sulfonate/bicarbonate transport system ATPase subunit
MTKEENTLLSIQNVFKTFKEAKLKAVEALHDISFTLQKGEFISIVGPSGCGKSTILRLIAGLEKTNDGKIIFENGTITDLNLGFIFQSYNSFPYLTVRQNLAFGLFNEKDKEAKNIKVNNWLQYTGLTDFAGFYPKKLSGGMQQRLAIARTMVTDPELLLMDEPFGALDIKTRETMQVLLLDMVRKTNCSVLFITHDLQEAIFLSDRIFLMSPRPGKITKIFSPSADKTSSKDIFKHSQNILIYNQIVSLL